MTDNAEVQNRSHLVAGIIGLAIVGLFLATCIWVDTGIGNAPAKVVVVSLESEPIGDRLAFTALVKNQGDHTAEQVLVRGEVVGANPVDHEIDFLAPGEEGEVSFLAPADTSDSDVAASVLAWTQSG